MLGVVVFVTVLSLDEFDDTIKLLTSEDDTVDEEEGDDPLDKLDVGVLVCVIVALLVTVALDEGVKLGVLDKLDVTEPDATLDSEEVGVFVKDAESDLLLDGVIVAVPVDEGVMVTVQEPLAVIVDVIEGVPLLEFVFDEEAPTLNEAVAEKDIDALRVIVEEADKDAVPVPEVVELAVGVTDAVMLELTVLDAVAGGEFVALNDVEGVPLADPPMLRVVVGDAVTVVEVLIVVQLLSLPEGV